MNRITLALLASIGLAGCGSHAMMGTLGQDGKAMQKVSTDNGTYSVGVLEPEKGTWVASFNNFFRGSPPVSTLRGEGVDLIEKVSGCEVVEEKVVVDLKWASVYAEVAC